MRLATFIACLGLSWATAGLAQDFPTRAITIVSSTSSGSASDMAGRVLAPRLQQRLGKAVVVENRTGASGNIGVASVVKAPPDGHTILIAPSTIAITPAIVKDLGWDPANDLQPVARVAIVTLALAVYPAVPAHNAKELVALALQRPGALNYASPGVGTPQHLGMELFKQITGANLTHVPYKGLAQAVTDLIGGRVEAGFYAVQSVLSHAKAGKLRLLATAGDQRTPWTGDVATLKEQGIVGADIDSWIGMFVPQGTPPAIVARLTQEVLALLGVPEVQDVLYQQGVQVNPASADELGRAVRADLERYRKIALDAHLQAE